MIRNQQWFYQVLPDVYCMTMIDGKWDFKFIRSKWNVQSWSPLGFVCNGSMYTALLGDVFQDKCWILSILDFPATGLHAEATRAIGTAEENARATSHGERAPGEWETGTDQE